MPLYVRSKDQEDPDSPAQFSACFLALGVNRCINRSFEILQVFVFDLVMFLLQPAENPGVSDSILVLAI